MTKNEFYDTLEKNNILLTDKMKNQFDQYYQLLNQYNQVMDLTNVIEEEQVYERHFYDSVCIAFNHNFNGLKVCDVGSGAGFPAIPLKIVFPEMDLVIIDSLSKRMNFLKEVIQNLELKNVKIEIARVEDVANQYRESFDIVTARAVARLNVLLELCTPLTKEKGLFIALKGKQGPIELKESQQAIKELNVCLQEERKYDEGINYYFKKEKKTNPKYPRKFAQIKKKPL